MYKKKNQELLNIVMKKKVKLNRSFGQLPEEEVLRAMKQEEEIEHNDKEMN